jgi:O-antigen/teichoic acid export membrane protein
MEPSVYGLILLHILQSMWNLCSHALAGTDYTEDYHKILLLSILLLLVLLFLYILRLAKWHLKSHMAFKP